MRRTLVLLGAAALTLSVLPARADWDVRRAAGDPRVSEALLEALLRTPDDRGALRRLLSHGGGKAVLLRVAARCDLRATDAQRLACGHLYREAGRVDLALARFDAVADADPRALRAAGELRLRLGRADDALTSLRTAVARPSREGRVSLLELTLAACTQARSPALEERRRLAEALAQELLALRAEDRALARRTAEALAQLGAPAVAARIIAGLGAATADPRARIPLLFRSADLFEAAEQAEPALAALDQALSILPIGDSRRREAEERVVAIERKRERLAELAARWSAWPEARRDAATEELLGRIRDELGDSSAARQHLARALRLDPRALGPRRLLIRLYTRAGDEEAAIAELRQLATTTRDDPRVALELAERMFPRPGGQKEAIALAVATGRRHRDATTHGALAALYQKWGDKDRALAEANLLVRLEPGEPEHLIALGELHDQQGNKALAQRTWRRLADGAAPTLPQVLRLADVLAEHDAAAEALGLLEIAAHDHPGDATVERRLGDVLERLHREREAEAIYHRVLERAVANDDAQVVRDAGGRWLELALRQGSPGATLGAFAVLADDPRSAARVELAFLVVRARLREKRGLEAERVLRRIVAVAQRSSDRARALEALAELPGVQAAGQALELLVTAAELDPGRAPLLYGKASQRAAELYRDDESLRYAQRAVTLGPLDADAHERLGTLLEPRDAERALASYDRAVELAPDRDRLRLRAAELALRRGDDEGAARRYRDLLMRARDEQALDDAARRAVVVHELTGRLGLLEREIAPRATSGDGPPALRRLLVDVERRYVPLLAARADAGDPAARAELARVSVHALAPLLDSIVDGDRDERRAAVLLLGQLGARGAAPLLLRLAAGEAARRGSEATPIELRAAAADAAAWLVTDEHLARLLPLSIDPEQRIRGAATLALARIASAPPPPPTSGASKPRHASVTASDRALAALLPRVADEHDRIAAIACLGLTHAPSNSPVWLAVAERALDRARPLTGRACGLALAERLERVSSGGGDESAHTLAQRLATATRDGVAAQAADEAKGTSSLRTTAGLARALLATGVATEIDGALVAILSDPALRRSLGGTFTGSDLRGASTTLRRASNGGLDLEAAINAREGIAPTSNSTSRHALLREAMLRVLAGPSGALVLADLATPRSVLPRLLVDLAPGGGAVADRDGASTARARADLLDAALPLLSESLGALRSDSSNHGESSDSTSSPAMRGLALRLLVERPDGIESVATALARPLDRNAALVALALPSASEIPVALVTKLLPALRTAMRAPDWRDRRAALVAIHRHPQLATSLATELASLRSDANGLVADTARLAETPGLQPADGDQRSR